MGLKLFVLFLNKHEDKVNNHDILARSRKQFISSARASHKQQAFQSPEHFPLARNEPSPEGNPSVMRRVSEAHVATRHGIRPNAFGTSLPDAASRATSQGRVSGTTNSGMSRNTAAHRECGYTHGGPNHQT